MQDDVVAGLSEGGMNLSLADGDDDDDDSSDSTPPQRATRIRTLGSANANLKR